MTPPWFTTSSTQFSASWWGRLTERRGGQDGGKGGVAPAVDHVNLRSPAVASTESSASAAAPSASGDVSPATFLVVAALTAVAGSLTFHTYRSLKRLDRRRSRHGETRWAPMWPRWGAAKGHAGAEVNIAAPRLGDSTKDSTIGHVDVHDCTAAACNFVESTLVTGQHRNTSRAPLQSGADACESMPSPEVAASLEERSDVKTLAAAAPPVPPMVLHSNFYDLEPYTKQGLAAGAHGWRRVFGLLHSQAARGDTVARTCRKQPEGGDDAATDVHCWASRSQTHTYDGTLTTADLYTTWERCDGGDPATPSFTPSAAQHAGSVASPMCSSSADGGGARDGRAVSSNSSVSGRQSTAATTTSITFAHLPSSQQDSAAALSNASVSSESRAHTCYPPSTVVIPQPLGALSLPVSHHVSLTGGCRTWNDSGRRSSATSAGASQAASSAITSTSPVVVQRNLQRNISSLVATTVSARPTMAYPTTPPVSLAPGIFRPSTEDGVTTSPSMTAFANTDLGASKLRCCSLPKLCRDWHGDRYALSSRPSSTSASRTEGDSPNETKERWEGWVEEASASRQQQRSGRAGDSSRWPVGGERLGEGTAGKLSDGQPPCGAPMGCLALREIRDDVLEHIRLGEGSLVSPLGSGGLPSHFESRAPASTSPQAAMLSAASSMREDDVACESSLPQPHAAADGVSRCSSGAPLARHALTELTTPLSEQPMMQSPPEMGMHHGPEDKPFSPTSVARRRTIAEQLTILTSRREQQRRNAQALLNGRHLRDHNLNSSTATRSPPSLSSSSVSAAGAYQHDLDLTATTSAAVHHAGFLGRGQRERLPSSLSVTGKAAAAWWQSHTDTAAGALYTSLRQAEDIENRAYSDFTNNSPQLRQRWPRDRLKDPHASTDSLSPTDNGGFASCLPCLSDRVASQRLRIGERVPLPAVSNAPASRCAVSTGPTSASASPPTTMLLSHDRRVDDLTVKYQDGDSATYSLSLTYHDSETGRSRTVNTIALPPLRRSGDAVPPIPGLSPLEKNMEGSRTARTKSPQPKQASSFPSPARSLTDGTAVISGTVAERGSRQLDVAEEEEKRWVSTEAEPTDLVEGLKAATQRKGSSCSSRDDGDGRAEEDDRQNPLTAARTGGITTIATAAAAAATGHPFAAPLPTAEPLHGPYLQGVAGRRGEMAIGAFLGGGACGKVYECLNTETGQVLAAKQIVFDAKDRKLRTRLRQLELELEVLTLAARHRVPWIVGFYGAEKRGHSVLMYLEYCQRGSLLDYMMMNDADEATAEVGEEPDGLATPATSSLDVGPHHPSGFLRVRDRTASHGMPYGPHAGCRGSSTVLATLGCDPGTSGVTAAGVPLSRQKSDCSSKPKRGANQRLAGEAAVVESIPERCYDGGRREELAPYVNDSAEAAGSSSSPNDPLTYPDSPQSTNTTSAECDDSDSRDARSRTQALPIAQIQCFTRQMVEGLNFLHEHHYAHLDVKTANVLVTADAQCRLADLGCAMRLQLKSLPTASTTSSGTGEVRDIKSSLNNNAAADGTSLKGYPILADRGAVTELRGTALYMAPETIRFESDAIGSPADVWSLGCVVMEMATGCAPWRHLAKDKLRVLYCIGSARSELPLPPVMRSWAEEAAASHDRDASPLLPCDCQGESTAPYVLPRDSTLGCDTQSQTGKRTRSGSWCRVPRRGVGVKLTEHGEGDGTVGDDSDMMAARVDVDLSLRCRRRVDDVPVCDLKGAPSAAAAATPHPCLSAGVASSYEERSPADRVPATISRTFGAAGKCRQTHSDLPIAKATTHVPSPPPRQPSCTGEDTEISTLAGAKEAPNRTPLSHQLSLRAALVDFVAACVRLRPEERSSTAELRHHPFLTL